MEETLFCIWLQCAFGAGSPVPEKIISQYPTLSAFYEGGINEWRLSGLLSEQQIALLVKTSIVEAVEVCASCKRHGYQIIARTSPLYPERLKVIPNPPAVLYVAGVWPDIDNELCIGMVGTRNASPMGVAAASRIAIGLSKAEAIVVSGGAVGIDTASHKGVLLSGGRTIAVLGCGLDANYLAENRAMRNEIRINGALVSEYPPGTPPRNYHFPIRNRIISGLSLGTVVVEAGSRSGAMITGQTALEQNRDVYAVFRNPAENWSEGVRKLVREGAKAVWDAADILVEYIYWIQEHAEMRKKAAELRKQIMEREAEMEIPKLSEEPILDFPDLESIWQIADEPSAISNESVDRIQAVSETEAKTVLFASQSDILSEKEPKPKSRKATPVEPVLQEKPTPKQEIQPETMDILSDEAKKLLAVLQPTDTHIDTLAEKAGLSVRDALMAVTELEMEGLISGKPGKRYSLA